MKYSIILSLFIFIPFVLYSQQVIIWQGGTPGRETSWNDPRNWNLHRIPDVDDKVIIKMENNGHFSQPIIDDEVQIAWMEIHSGAELTIASSGKLTVDGTYTYSEGISLYGGSINSNGKIIFKDIETEFIALLSPICSCPKDSFYTQLPGY